MFRGASLTISFGLLTLVANTAGLPNPTVLIVPFIVMLFLVALNGLSIAAEFSLIKLNINQIELQAESGHHNAQRLLTVINNSAQHSNYLATAQVGITLASLGLGMYGEPHIAAFVSPYLSYASQQTLGVPLEPTLLETFNYLIAISLLTYLHVVVGRMFPKSLALISAESIATTLVHPMHLSQRILHYPVTALYRLSTWLLRLMRVPSAENYVYIHSTEELERIVAESAEEGLLEETEHAIILNIFDFGDRQVGQVMTPRRKVEAISHTTPLPEILELVSESKHSRFPVYQNSLDTGIIGILHVNDLLRQQVRQRQTGRKQFDLRLLLRPAPIVPEQYPIDKLLAAFRRQRIHMAVVLDEFGGTAGIVTLEDLVEEVVGEVRDEFDLEPEPLIEIAPGVLEVSGRYLIEDLTDEVDLGNEEDLPNVETVGGLITTELGRPPQVNDCVTYNKAVRLTVLSVDGLAVGRARVEFPIRENGEET